MSLDPIISAHYARLAHKANAALRGTKTAKRRARKAARARWKNHNEQKAAIKQTAIQHTQTDDITDIWFTQ